MKGSENMEEKKMSPILIVILSVLGTCLVGFCVWYGVNYFKDDVEPEGPTPETPVEEPINNVTEDYVDGEYHTYIVYSSKNSENYKKVDYSKLFVLKPYDEAEEEVLISADNVITLKGYPNIKDKSLKVDEKIVSALIDSDCSGSISIYYLTESKKLYYADLYSDEGNHEEFKANLIDTNVEKIGYANLNRFTTCGGKTIAYKKVGDDNNYKAIGYYGFEQKKTIVGSKDMKYENYDEALYDGDYSNILVLYKNYPNKKIDDNSVILKDSKGKDLYIKGAFVSSEQYQKENKNYIYFLGEDDYLYHYPYGYSTKNVKAVKYNDSKVKKITPSKTKGWEPIVLTIEYENGKTEKINADSYEGCTNLDL